VIDNYNIVEDSYNNPVHVEADKKCIDSWQLGKTIYPSVELCADAVKGNTTNCASGNGFFYYSPTEKLCRCCTNTDPTANLEDSTDGSNLYQLSTDHGVWGKFVYNYTKQVGKCIDDNSNSVGAVEQDWVTVEFCQETCDNDANCYAF
jgi:hypothetical protein